MFANLLAGLIVAFALTTSVSNDALAVERLSANSDTSVQSKIPPCCRPGNECCKTNTRPCCRR